MDIDDTGWVKVTEWDTAKNQSAEPLGIHGGTYWVYAANLGTISE
jgi:hypothetical protein